MCGLAAALISCSGLLMRLVWGRLWQRRWGRGNGKGKRISVGANGGQQNTNATIPLRAVAVVTVLLLLLLEKTRAALLCGDEGARQKRQPLQLHVRPPAPLAASLLAAAPPSDAPRRRGGDQPRQRQPHHSAARLRSKRLLLLLPGFSGIGILAKIAPKKYTFCAPAGAFRASHEPRKSSENRKRYIKGIVVNIPFLKRYSRVIIGFVGKRLYCRVKHYGKLKVNGSQISQLLLNWDSPLGGKRMYLQTNQC